MSGTASEESVRCTAYEVANPPAYYYCGECGTGLPEARWACVHLSPPGQRFCGECGAPLGESGTSKAGGTAPETTARLRDIAAYTPNTSLKDP